VLLTVTTRLIYSLLISLVYCGWKYCSLVCRERKTLLDDCWFHWIAQTNRAMVTKFPGQRGWGTGLRNVVRYIREIFTLRVENEPANLGQESKTSNLFYATMNETLFWFDLSQY
jgi:hypothetical protein